MEFVFSVLTWLVEIMEKMVYMHRRTLCIMPPWVMHSNFLAVLISDN
jgi:hypothetical protein